MNYTSALKTNDNSKFYPETEINQIHGFTDGFFDVVDNTTFLCGDSSSWKKSLDGGEIVYAPVSLESYAVNNIPNYGTLTNIDDYIAFDTSNTTTMRRMFRSCASVTSIDVSHFDTSNVTNMQSMFSTCTSLTSIDLSNFDTSNVTNFGSMFQNCSSLTSVDLSMLDTFMATNVGYLFSGCTNLTSVNLSGWDFSIGSSSNVNQMGTSCSSLKTVIMRNCRLGASESPIITLLGSYGALTTPNPVEHVDLRGLNSNAVTIVHFFDGLTTLKVVDLTGWDTSGITNFNKLFNGCTNLESIGDITFDLSGCTRATALGNPTVSPPYGMFYGCDKLGQLGYELKFKNVPSAIWADEATLRTRAGIPEGCVVQIQNFI